MSGSGGRTMTARGPRRGVASVLTVIGLVLSAACSGGGSPGPEEIDDRGEFTRRAAALCGEVVDRRSQDRYLDKTTAILEAVAATLRGRQPPESTAQALDTAIRENEQTLDELRRIAPSDPEWASAWSQITDAVQHALDKQKARAAALASGDTQQVQAAFQPDRSAPNVDPPLRALQLSERDCRFLLR